MQRKFGLVIHSQTLSAGNPFTISLKQQPVESFKCEGSLAKERCGSKGLFFFAELYDYAKCLRIVATLHACSMNIHAVSIWNVWHIHTSLRHAKSHI